jgi:hypothetical protein
VRKIGFVILILALVFAVGCGGSSSSSGTGSTGSTGTGGTGGTSTTGSNQTIAALTSGTNVAPLIVDAGPLPATSFQVNVAYTTVTICPHGSSTCATIYHIAVDTGSTGLRIPASVFPTVTNGAAVLASLPNVGARPVSPMV